MLTDFHSYDNATKASQSFFSICSHVQKVWQQKLYLLRQKWTVNETFNGFKIIPLSFNMLISMSFFYWSKHLKLLRDSIVLFLLIISSSSKSYLQDKLSISKRKRLYRSKFYSWRACPCTILCFKDLFKWKHRLHNFFFSFKLAPIHEDWSTSVVHNWTLELKEKNLKTLLKTYIYSLNLVKSTKARGTQHIVRKYFVMIYLDR